MTTERQIWYEAHEQLCPYADEFSRTEEAFGAATTTAPNDGLSISG